MGDRWTRSLEPLDSLRAPWCVYSFHLYRGGWVTRPVREWWPRWGPNPRLPSADDIDPWPGRRGAADRHRARRLPSATKAGHERAVRGLLRADAQAESLPFTCSEKRYRPDHRCCYQHEHGLREERDSREVLSGGAAEVEAVSARRDEPLSPKSIRHSWGEQGATIIRRVHGSGPADETVADEDGWYEKHGTTADRYGRAAGSASLDDAGLERILTADNSTKWQVRRARGAATRVVPFSGPLPSGVKRHGLGYRQRVSLFGQRIESPTYATPTEAVAWGTAARRVRDLLRASELAFDHRAAASFVLLEMGAST